MAGDLEKFLQEAAERLAQRVNQSNAPAEKRKPPRQVRQSERAPLEPELVDAEIVDAEIVSSGNPRELGPNPLSNIDTRQSLAQEVGRADEKMAEHIQDVLDHDVGRLGDASDGFSGAGKQSSSKIASQVDRREHMVSPLVDMLRRPETLRAAFIASEIFKRKA